MVDDELTTSDSDLALMMSMGNEDGLRLLIRRYGGGMKAYLQKHFSDTLQEGERAEALSTAIDKIWRFAGSYDESKGKLSSWCIRITQRVAQDILKRETKYRSKNLEYDPTYDPAGDPSEDTMAVEDLKDDPRLEILYQAIEMLPTLQKAIIKADLAADGEANAQRLAEIHNTSKGSIYVSRNKAREKLKELVEQLNRQPVKKRN